MQLTRRDLLTINASNLVLLGTGFISTLLVPRLAIKAMGVDRYGVYALLLGYCLIPTIMDLGLMPGLTRELGLLAEAGNFVEASLQLSKIRRWLALGAVAVALSVAVAASMLSRLGKEAFWPVLFGATANATVLFGDVTLLKLRVSTKIVAANLVKCLYYGAYLACVCVFAIAGKLGLEGLMASQLIGATVYAGSSLLTGRRVWNFERCHSGASTHIRWRKLFHTAAPEQMNRLQNAALPGIERSVMFEIGGGAVVGAYDVALRMAALVIAAPAALSDPLIALLSSRQQADRREERAMIIRHSVWLGLATLACSLIVTGLFVKLFAVNYYHMQGTRFLQITAFVVFGSAINVLTAPAVAHFYAISRPGPVIAKIGGEIVFVIFGLVAACYFGDPLIYIAVRYCSHIVTAGGLVTFSVWGMRPAAASIIPR
jgi:hypothetical protein